MHRLIFGLREGRFAQQEQAEAPELLRHSVLLFLNAISVVVHSPARSLHNDHGHEHKVPLLWHDISVIVHSPLIVSLTVISGQEALIRAVQFIRVFPT